MRGLKSTLGRNLLLTCELGLFLLVFLLNFLCTLAATYLTVLFDIVVISISLLKLLRGNIINSYNSSGTHWVYVLSALSMMAFVQDPRTVLGMFRSLLLIMHCAHVSTSGTAPDDPRTKGERQRRGEAFEEERLLDKVEQGYFLFRWPEVDLPGATFAAAYVNRFGKTMLTASGLTFPELAAQLVVSDDPSTCLYSLLEQVFGPEYAPGYTVKHFLRLAARKRSISKDDLSPRARAREQSIEEQTDALTIMNLKARLTKVRKNEVLLSLSEHNITSTLIMAEGLRNTVICTLSHELKNLLTGIICNLELIGQHLAMKGQDMLYHKLATCSAGLLSNRLNDLFDYIQLRYKQFKLHYAEFSLAEFVSELEEICHWQAQQRQQNLKVIKKKSFPKSIIGDHDRLTQILLNIINKSIEFTDFRSQLELRVGKTKEKKIAFTVRSYGAAMRTKLKEYLKDSPRNTWKELRRNSVDTSNGVIQNIDTFSLEISQLICKEMDADITVKIEKDQKYSQFKLVLRDGFQSPRLRSPNKKRRLSNDDKSQEGSEPTPQVIAHSEMEKAAFGKTHYFPSPFSGQPPSKPDKSMFARAPPPGNESSGVDSSARLDNSRLSGFSRDDFTEREIPSEFIQLERKISIPHSPTKRVIGYSPPFNPQKSPSLLNISVESKDSLFRLQPNGRGVSLRTRRTTFCENAMPIKIRQRACLDDVDKCTILIADDDTLNRNALKGLLKINGLYSLEACDGREAVCLIEKYVKTNKLSELSVIFMDLQMPNMNGIQAVAAIRELCSKYNVAPPYIVGVSCDNSEEDRRNFVRAGLNEFVSKPLTNKKLKLLIEKYVGANSAQ